jgi:uncharacterized C2H2 Zn-finger protein
MGIHWADDAPESGSSTGRKKQHASAEPVNDCPRCGSSRVLRTMAINELGEELLFCPHCDHMWARSKSAD